MESVIREFDISGELLEWQPLKTGHINDTYLVSFRQGRKIKPYLFQRINHYVFKDPAGLMDNILRITGHIRKKLIASGIKDIYRRVLTVVFTRSGQGYHRDSQGNFWRAYIYITEATTHDTLRSPAQGFEIARAFGHFQHLLSDFTASSLNETIVDFHNGERRYEQFVASAEKDVLNRAILARREIDFLNRQAAVFAVIPDLLKRGILKKRTSHNDTKINNVLLDDKTGEGICVVDLDTVMPGLSLYDFGDLARTTLSPTAEDESDVTKVTLEISIFSAILKGFLSSAGTTMSHAECEYLVHGVQFMTLIVGCRFLTDFLDGDIYFKVRYPEHNLHRCRTQFRLLELVQAKEDELMHLVHSFSESG